MGVRISNSIILDKRGRHNYLKEIGQAIQINIFSGAKALYDTNFLSQGLHLTFDLTITRL